MFLEGSAGGGGGQGALDPGNAEPVGTLLWGWYRGYQMPWPFGAPSCWRSAWITPGHAGRAGAGRDTCPNLSHICTCIPGPGNFFPHKDMFYDCTGIFMTKQSHIRLRGSGVRRPPLQGSLCVPGQPSFCERVVYSLYQRVSAFLSHPKQLYDLLSLHMSWHFQEFCINGILWCLLRFVWLFALGALVLRFIQ